MEWRVYYEGGETFSDEDGPPEQAPKVGVLVIACSDTEVGRRLEIGYDWYLWRNGEWVGGDVFGLADHLAQPGWSLALRGRRVDTKTYHDTVLRARGDAGLPPKSAKLPRERLPVL